MILADLHLASELSHARKAGWLQLAWGQSSRLESLLGSPVVGHLLPGLGEIAGWGLVDEDRNISGAIYAGFHPNPTSVVFLLSARVVENDKLSLDPLETLAQLPV